MLEKLKLEDIDLRYSAFTLRTAAEELDLEWEVAQRLLSAVHIQLKDCTDDDKFFPDLITVDSIRECGAETKEEFLETGLIEETDPNLFQLSVKGKKLFKRAAQEQKALVDAGFEFKGIIDPIIFYVFESYSNEEERP